MKLNNAAEMIADLKLRQSEVIKDNHSQSEVIKDNQSQSDSDSEQSDTDIIDNDINLDSIIMIRLHQFQKLYLIKVNQISSNTIVFHQ